MYLILIANKTTKQKYHHNENGCCTKSLPNSEEVVDTDYIKPNYGYLATRQKHKMYFGPPKLLVN
jgi:hypothetical protein